MLYGLFDFQDQIEKTNGTLKIFCYSEGYKFIENLNVVCLNCSKSHLNKIGMGLLAKNIANIAKYI